MVRQSLSDSRTMSAPGSELSSASNAEASRTTLVTLDLGSVVVVYFVGETDTARRRSGKLRLHVGKHPIRRLDVEPLVYFGDDDRCRPGDVVAARAFRRQRDSSRCIHFEAVDLLLPCMGRSP